MVALVTYPAPNPRGLPSRYPSTTGSSQAVLRRPHVARLRVRRINVLSALKVAGVLSVCLGAIFVVSITATWWMLDATGTFASLNANIVDVVGASRIPFDILEVLSLPSVLKAASVLATVGIITTCAIVALGSFMYNISVGVTGGVELAVADRGGWHVPPPTQPMAGPRP